LTVLELARANGHAHAATVLADWVAAKALQQLAPSGSQGVLPSTITGSRSGQLIGSASTGQWSVTQIGAAVMRSDTAAVIAMLGSAGGEMAEMARAADSSGGGATALHYAAIAGQPLLVRRLIDCGADIGARMDDGRTALHLANGAAVALELLRHGADTTVRDNLGLTPAELLVQPVRAGKPAKPKRRHQRRPRQAGSASGTRAPPSRVGRVDASVFRGQAADAELLRQADAAPTAAQAAAQMVSRAEGRLHRARETHAKLASSHPLSPAEIQARWQPSYTDEDVLRHFYRIHAPTLASDTSIARILRRQQLRGRGQPWRTLEFFRVLKKKYGVDPRAEWLAHVDGRTSLARGTKDEAGLTLRRSVEKILAKEALTPGPEDGGRPKEEEEEEEDQALWLQQMASNAAAGNLDLADLAEPASLPTLLRLLALPSLRAPVCEAIVSMASGAASEEAPSVGWGAVLRPLLDADRKLAGTSAWPTLAIEAVLAWRHRASIAEEAATDGDAKKLADVASPPPPPPSLSMRGGRAAAAAAIGRWGYARQRLAAAP
jgi:hypothetical protein